MCARKALGLEKELRFSCLPGRTHPAAADRSEQMQKLLASGRTDLLHRFHFQKGRLFGLLVRGEMRCRLSSLRREWPNWQGRGRARSGQGRRHQARDEDRRCIAVKTAGEVTQERDRLGIACCGLQRASVRWVWDRACCPPLSCTRTGGIPSAPL